MAGDMEERIGKLERLLFGPPTEGPYWEAFSRRVRISRLYLAWREGEIEQPELDDTKDREAWERMEGYWRVLEELEEEGAFGARKGSLRREKD